ncbi:ArsR/SmtB family transcription factor [Labrys neptuniae]|uniref:ArsR family transcriptional regulator n=1 Tax=Labrys neptuniae TaxID=376174 RepID=A0ABV3PLW2_9HYPH
MAREAAISDQDDHPSREEITLGSILAALADPHRRRVVATLVLAPDGTEIGCSSFGLPVTKATRTYHFRMLREAGLIGMIDYGNCRKTYLRRADIEAKFPGLLAWVVAEAEAASG